MAIANRSLKSVRDIRTHSGTVGQKLKPHEIHMRLSVLEMERERREKERENALLRIRKIEERLREIDDEKNDLLRVMAGDTGRLPDSGGSAVERRSAGDPPDMKGFKLKY